jgi:hypothetical protein
MGASRSIISKTVWVSCWQSQVSHYSVRFVFFCPHIVRRRYELDLGSPLCIVWQLRFICMWHDCPYHGESWSRCGHVSLTWCFLFGRGYDVTCGHHRLRCWKTSDKIRSSVIATWCNWCTHQVDYSQLDGRDLILGMEMRNTVVTTSSVSFYDFVWLTTLVTPLRVPRGCVSGGAVAFI